MRLSGFAGALAVGLVVLAAGVLGGVFVPPNRGTDGGSVAAGGDTPAVPGTPGTATPNEGGTTTPHGEGTGDETIGSNPPISADPGSGVLQPAFGLCPGAPPVDGGMQRRPDTARDFNGTLHMVWSERFDGQFDVCYAKKPGEMGLGSDDNPAFRITNTPYESTEPHIAIDPVSGIIYVVWVEEFPDAGDDGIYEAVHIGKSVLYTATENGTFWTIPIQESNVPGAVKNFEVNKSEGTVRFGNGEPGPRPPAGGGKPLATYRYVFDTDRDGIKDSDEFLGILGNVTLWWNSDTDGDGMPDRMEFVYGFNPIISDIRGPYYKSFLEILFQNSDFDRDSISFAGETACNFPVTSGYANVLTGGSASYRFWPMTAYSAALNLDLQIRRQGILYTPPPTTANYTVSATVNAGPAGTFTFSQSGNALEWNHVIVEFGSFSVLADTQTDVQLSITVEQPSSNGFRTMGVFSVMIYSTVGSAQFSYKEGRDFQPGASLASALTDNYLTCGDPSRPDLFLEVDTISGHNPTPDVFSEAINAFSDAGIILHYRLDETSISPGEATTTDSDGDGATTLNDCTAPVELQNFLATHRSTASPYDRYLHVIFVNNVKAQTTSGCQNLYGIAMSADLATDLTHSGVLVADDQLDSMISTATVAQQRLKVLIHEVGHALGASHEKSNGLYNACVDGGGGTDTLNGFNVMGQDGLSTAAGVNDRILGVGNTARCKGAVSFIGMPRFSIESINQFDLTNKLSVNTGRNIDLLGNYV